MFAPLRCAPWIACLLPTAALGAGQLFDFEAERLPPQLVNGGTQWTLDAQQAFRGLRSLSTTNPQSYARLKIDLAEETELSFAYRIDGGEDAALDVGLGPSPAQIVPFRTRSGWQQASILLPPGPGLVSFFAPFGCCRGTGFALHIDDLRLLPVRLGPERMLLRWSDPSIPPLATGRMLAWDIDLDGQDELIHSAYRDTGQVGHISITGWSGSRLRSEWASRALPKFVSAMAVLRVEGRPILVAAAGPELFTFDLSTRRQLARTLIAPSTTTIGRLALVETGVAGGIDVHALLFPQCASSPCPSPYLSSFDLHSGQRHWSVTLAASSTDLALGDFCPEPGLELAVAGVPGQIFAAADGRRIWEAPDGFGGQIVAGRFVDPARLQLVGADATSHGSLTVFDCSLRAAIKELPPNQHLTANDYPGGLAARDRDGDGYDEIWVGDAQRLRVIDPRTSQVSVQSFDVSRINAIAPMRLHGESAITALFSARRSTHLQEGDLLLASSRAGIGTVRLGAEAAPFGHIELADVNRDGREDLVYVTTSTDYTGGDVRIHVLDMQTLVETSTSAAIVASTVQKVFGFDVGQLDSDAELEVAIAFRVAGGKRLNVYDVHGAIERSVSRPNDFSSIVATPYPPIIVGIDQVLFGERGAVELIRPSTGQTLRTIRLSGSESQVQLGDIDQDGKLELLAFGSDSVRVLDFDSGVEEWRFTPRDADTFAADFVQGRIFSAATGAQGNIISGIDARTRQVFPEIGLHCCESPLHLFPLVTPTRDLLLVTSQYGFSAYDRTTGRRLNTQRNEPNFIPRHAVPRAISGNAMIVWGTSDHAVQRLDLELRAQPEFADGFED